MPETQGRYKARILSYLDGREPLPLLTAAPDTLAALLAAVPPALFACRPAPESGPFRRSSPISPTTGPRAPTASG